MPPDVEAGLDHRTVGDVGERLLLARLRARLSVPPRDVWIGIGDDAAVVEPPRGALDVITTDALVEGVHFDRRFCRPAEIGRKALAVNVSDLGAMGAQPRLALLSLGLPDALPVATFDEFLDGFLSAAAEQHVALVGGNLTRSPGPWFIDVTAVGTARRRHVMARGGASPGHELFVTGHLGAARAGLAWLRQQAEDGSGATPSAEVSDAIDRYRCPASRVRAGVTVARSRSASACMDLSDGLADAVTQVAEASGAGATIELDLLPLHPAVPLVWPADAPWQALLGGEDYELLFAVPPRRRRGFLAAMAHGRRVPVTRVGRLTDPAEGLGVRRSDGSTVPLPRGYEHFA